MAKKPQRIGINSLLQGVNTAQIELDRITKSEKRERSQRFVLAALSSIPWVGGFLAASASLDAELDQAKVNKILRQWLEEHQAKLGELVAAMSEITDRVRAAGPEAEKRVESPEYLGLVRKGFGVWDRADTKEKRKLIEFLLSNAAATTLADDDLIRLFIDWIDRYHEAHFAVIRTIFNGEGPTRSEIWHTIYGRQVREDSAEADLFKLLIRDLSTGSVLRQHRETTADGQFLRKARTATRRGYSSPVTTSAFDDTEHYELTELGKKFVHYVLSDVVPRLSNQERTDGSE